MAIHHDKMAYGRLQSMKEELSEEKIAEMLRELNETDEALADQKQKKAGKKNVSKD